MALFELIKNMIYVVMGKENPNYIPQPTYTSKTPIKKEEIDLDLGAVPSLPWKGVVIHNSGDKDDNFCDDIERIKKYHMSYRIDYVPVTKEEFERRKAAGLGKKFELPWKTIGYHIIIEKKDGKLRWEIGRPLDMIGAHAGHKVSNRFNETHIGLCMVGNFDIDDPTEYVEYAIKIIRYLMRIFNFQKEEVIGHREVYDKLGVPREKTCPGGRVNLDKLRGDL